MAIQKKSILIVTALLFLASGLASAAAYDDSSLKETTIPQSYLYLGGFGGLAFTSSGGSYYSTYVPINNFPTYIDLTNTHYDTGWQTGAMLGVKGKYFRLEAEYLLYNADISRFNAAGVKQTNAKGNTKIHAGLANLYYDILTIQNRFTPYIGVGLGYATSADTSLQSTGPAPGPIATRYTSGALVYQGIAGINMDINDQLATFVDFRHLTSTDLEDGWKPPISIPYQKLRINSLNLGLKVKLNV